MNFRTYLTPFLVSASLAIVFLGPASAGSASFFATPEYQRYKSILREKTAIEERGVVPMPKKDAVSPEDAVFSAVAKKLASDPVDIRALYERFQSEAPKAAAEEATVIQGKLATLGAQNRLRNVSLAGRVEMVRIDTDSAHLVAYVRWTGGDRFDVEEEACLIASEVARDAKYVDTIALGAVENGANLFAAKISQSAAEKIDPKRILDFCDTRYLRLFEEVELAQ